MSTTTFVEATSADPFVRDLHRKAVRLLNDPSLDRRQREFHMRRLQSILLEHEAKQAANAKKLAANKAKRALGSIANRNQGIADPSQVVARRREFGVAEEERQLAQIPTVPAPVAANYNRLPGRNRPVLKLKRA